MATDLKTSQENDLGPAELTDFFRLVRATANGRLDLRDLLRLFDGAPVDESGAARDLLDLDQGTYLRFTHAGAKTCTLLEESSDGYNDWYTLTIRNVGSGDLTITGESTNVMINAPAGGSLVLSQGMTATIKRVGLNEFDVFGQTAP